MAETPQNHDDKGSEPSRWFVTPDYLAIFVAIGALIVSLYQPLRDTLAQPRIRVTASEFAFVSTNLGIPMLSPTVMVVNDGSGSGSFANIGCTLHGGQERIEFSVPTINVPQGFGVPAVPQAFVGSSLEPNGVFLNSINCRSREIDEDLADEYADLLLSAQTFFRMVPGFNCGLQYAHRNVQLPQKVTQDLERFFDKNFSLTPDGYRFSLYVSDLENTEVAAFAAWITLTENAVQRLRNQKELLKYGFGTVCPPPPEASVEVLLRYQSIET